MEYSVDIQIKGWLPSFIEDMLADQGLEDATRWVKHESKGLNRKNMIHFAHQIKQGLTDAQTLYVDNADPLSMCKPL